MNPLVERVLDELEAQQQVEDAIVGGLTAGEVDERRDEWLLSVGRDTGLLLHILARGARARSILELGTARGYSTVWLADAARETGGRVVTMDVVGAKQERARAAVSRAGLADVVDFRTGDAVALLACSDEVFDFVLLDVWKDAYIPCVDAVLPRLAAPAIVVADNMQFPAVARLAAARYHAHVRAMRGVDTILLPVGSGLAVSRFTAAATPELSLRPDRSSGATLGARA